MIPKLSTLSDVVTTTVLIPCHDGVSRSESMQGRAAVGLYPEVSRTKLAAMLGKHVSSIGCYLKGRTATPLAVAVVLAREIGVSVERLNQELEEEQRKYRVQKSAKAAAKARAKAAATKATTKPKANGSGSGSDSGNSNGKRRERKRA